MYDIIIGNPPYNAPSHILVHKGAGGRNNIWQKFVELSLRILNDSGYLCFIHPNKWRKPDDKLWPLMTANQIRYLEIHSKQDGLKHFNATTRYDVYVLEKTKPYTKTHIKDELGEDHYESLMDWPWLPNFEFDLIKDMIVKDDCEIIYSRSMYGSDKQHMDTSEMSIHRDAPKDIIYDSIYESRHHYLDTSEKSIHRDAPTKPFPCVSAMTKKGLKFCYSDKDRGHFGIPKVIVSTGQYPYPLNDYDGKYGMCHRAFGIPIKSKAEGDRIVDWLSGPEMTRVLKATKWGIFQIEKNMFKYLKCVRRKNV